MGNAAEHLTAVWGTQRCVPSKLNSRLESHPGLQTHRGPFLPLKRHLQGVAFPLALFEYPWGLKKHTSLNMNSLKALNIKSFQRNLGFITKPKLFHPLAYTVLPCESCAPEREGHESTYNKQKKMEVLEDVLCKWWCSCGYYWPTFVFQLSTDIKTERMTKASLHNLVLLFSHPSQHWKMRLDLF